MLCCSQSPLFSLWHYSLAPCRVLSSGVDTLTAPILNHALTTHEHPAGLVRLFLLSYFFWAKLSSESRFGGRFKAAPSSPRSQITLSVPQHPIATGLWVYGDGNGIQPCAPPLALNMNLGQVVDA